MKRCDERSPVVPGLSVYVCDRAPGHELPHQGRRGNLVAEWRRNGVSVFGSWLEGVTNLEGK